MIGQQLEPLEAAESQLRFVEVDQDELEADYQELIDQINSETNDEDHLNSALTSLIDQLNKISNEMPDFDRNDLNLIQKEALPAIQKQLDEINDRDADARKTRKSILREWPSEAHPEKAQQLINSIIEKEVDCLRKIKEQETKVHVDEWLSKKQELDQQIFGVTSTTEQLLQRYADSLEPTNVNEAENDTQQALNLSEQLQRAKDLLKNAIDWLTNSNLPNETKTATLEYLYAEKEKLDKEDECLKNLQKQLNDELSKQKELNEKFDELQVKLTRLQNEASNILTLEAEQKRLQIDTLQQQIQPLLQEVSEMQKQSELQSSKIAK